MFCCLVSFSDRETKGFRGQVANREFFLPTLLHLHAGVIITIIRNLRPVFDYPKKKQGNQQLNVLDVDVSDQSFAERREHTDNTGSHYQKPAMDSMLGDQELETIAETVIETNLITEGGVSFYV